MTLLDADDQTRIVPAMGPVMTKADLQANYATIGKIREKLVGLVKKGQGAQNMIDAKAVDECKDVMPGDASTDVADPDLVGPISVFERPGDRS